jgi:acetyl-CoA carboxylase biotin carboxyl carrier protein
MNLKELKELIELIKNSEVTELELEKSGVRVRIKKERGIPAAVPPLPVEAAVPEMPAAAVKEPAPSPMPEEQKGMVTVTAPVVGTFYRSPAPDADAYVEVGTAVKKGQVVCVIEAMKLMNEIEAECDGKITAILVENAQPVEYGQPLFLIEPVGGAG